MDSEDWLDVENATALPSAFGTDAQTIVLSDQEGDEPTLDPYDDGMFLVAEDSSDDGLATTQLVELADSVMLTLKQVGLVGARLVLQEDEAPELLTQVLSEMGITATYTMRAHLLERIYREIRLAEAEERLRKRSRGDHCRPSLARTWDVLAALEEEARTKAKSLDLAMMAALPCRGRRKLRRIPDVDQSPLTDFQRKEADEAKMRSLQLQLVEYLTDVNAPSVLQAKCTSDPTRTLMGIMGRTRVSTAAKYLRIWKEYRSWLREAFDVAWPTEVRHFVDFLYVLRERPCGPTVPQKFFQTCRWMMKKAGFRGSDLVTDAPLLRETMDRIATEIVYQPIRQACRFPIAVLGSLELYLADESRAPFKRIAAGALLFRVWGTLRFDDQQHIHRHQLRLVGDYAVADLLISKTSGPGCRVKQLPVAIALRADLLGLSWLATFLELIQTHMPRNTDYLLDGCDRTARFSNNSRQLYHEAAAMTQRVVSELKIPKFEEGQWKASETYAVPKGLEDLFSQHAPRTTVPSLAVHVESDKSKRDGLGRWLPGQAGGSSDYVRTFRDVVGAVQIKVATAIKEGHPELVKEADILDRAARHLRERRNWDEEAIRVALDEWREILTAFPKHLQDCTNLVSQTEYVPLSDIVSRAAAVQTKTLQQSTETKHGKVMREKRFVITYSRGRKFARLHCTDKKCFWASASVRDSETFDVVRAEMYDSRCKFCWPELSKPVTVAESSNEESSEDDSDDSVN